MNEIIRDVLEERADHARTPHVDAAGLIRAGRRRRTVRRGIATASFAAVAALSVAITSAVVDLADRDAADPASEASKLPVPYADADTLYFGDLSVPRPEYLYGLSYASEAGYLAYYTIGSENDGIFVMTADGAVRKVSDATNLVGDGEREVAWLERSSGGWEVVTYRGSGELARIEIGSGASPRINAVDDGTVYYSQGDGVWSVTEGERPERVSGPSTFMVDRADGVAAIAPTSALGSGEPLPATVTVRDSEGRLVGRIDGLPPYGRLRGDGEAVWFLGEVARGPVLINVRSSERTFFDTPSTRVQYAAFVADRVVLAAFSQGTARLLSCSLSGDCRVVDEQDIDAADGLPYSEDQYLLPDITYPMD